MRTKAVRRRPVPCPGYVWCDAHGAIHDAKADPYDEGMAECRRVNWRPVYVLAEPGEQFT